MSIMKLDSMGRLTLPKQIRKSMDIGKKMLIINGGDHLKIIPLPLTPLKPFTAPSTSKILQGVEGTG